MKNLKIPAIFIILSLLLIWGCKKKNNSGPIPGSQYTSMMGGNRNWHIHYFTENCPGYITNIDTYYDSSFSVKIINNVTVSIPQWSNNLIFNAYDSINQTVTFANNYGSSHATITYSYIKDSMNFTSLNAAIACEGIYYNMATY